MNSQEQVLINTRPGTFQGYSSLSKTVGEGDRRAWKKIIMNPKFAKYFEILIQNKNLTVIRTALTIGELREIYRKSREDLGKMKRQAANERWSNFSDKL